MEIEARREHEEGTKTDLFKLMKKQGRDRLTSGIWERALDHEDKLALKLIERAVEMLGTGIASACNLLDPEAVIIGGGLGIRLGPRYMDPLKKEMQKHLFVDDRPPAVEIADARRPRRGDRRLAAARPLSAQAATGSRLRAGRRRFTLASTRSARKRPV